jgi:hypothetical protein
LAVLNTSNCDECGRILYERGGLLMIEAARTLKGGSPADDFLRDLEHDRQFDMLADVAIRFEELARRGRLGVPLQMRFLDDGIHEIKTPRVRLLFYYAEHPRCRSVRLTNGFIKRGQACPPKHIRTAQRVRGDDVQL